MANRNVENIVIENAKIIFKNFSGEKTKYNREGSRNFCVLIDDPIAAKELSNIGWNVKELSPRDEGDDVGHYISVQINFENIPPKIVLVSKKGNTLLNEDTISTLDYASIKNIDLTIRPYCWEVDGKSGIKAYVKNLYATIDEDEFSDKYGI